MPHCLDAVCKDKSKPTCIFSWKVRRWAHAYIPLNPPCILSSTSLNSTVGLRQDMLPKSVEILMIKCWLLKTNVHLSSMRLKFGERSTESMREGWSYYSVLKKLEFTRDILHGVNPCWKLFDTVILCVLRFISEGLFYPAARFSSIVCHISLKGKTHSEFI